MQRRASGLLMAATLSMAALCGFARDIFISPAVTLADEPPEIAISDADASRVTIYSADPTHPLNRLHVSLFTRKAHSGKVYGQDDIDPWLWPNSRFLLDGDHHRQVVQQLDDVLSRGTDILPEDPLRRAILQSDLWAVFDWLSSPEAQVDADRPQRRELQVRLSRLIRRLALPEQTIRSLPDNFAQAVASRAFPAHFDPDQPTSSFLPPDLFQSQGPWVLLGQHMKSTAPAHVRFVSGRSAFFIFLNLPSGRAATLRYLEHLQQFPNPLVPQKGSQQLDLNPNLPQFPAGTQVALARVMLLIDQQGRLTPTRLLQSLQVRVFRDVSAAGDSRQKLLTNQNSYEFRFTRQDLISGRNGGLHAVGPQDSEFLLFNSHPHDVFENAEDHQRPVVIMQTCTGCHARGSNGDVGIHSVLAYRRGFTADSPAPFLREYDREFQEEAVMAWKHQHYSWGLLQGLWDRDN